jgi:RHS repeat-associated protein
MDMTYTYSGTNNNGQITQSVDAVSGETIVYQYDALKRLASANGLNWGETYTYDGFGNLTQMSPSGNAGAPTLSVTVDATTNRITPGLQVSYDNNGNMTQSGYLGYDVANRMTSAIVQGGTIYYGYDSANRRIYYRNTSNAETIYLYGADGKKLGTYTVSSVTNTAIQFTQQSTNVYFAGKLLGVSEDRLESVRYGGASGVGYQAQYPYGVEYTPTVNDREKYATYTRDSLTGLDYAVNRYYTSLWGRFLSPDRYTRSAHLGKPESWNRYTYAGNDPINAHDPTGLDEYVCWVNDDGEEICDFGQTFGASGLGVGDDGDEGYYDPGDSGSDGFDPGPDPVPDPVPLPVPPKRPSKPPTDPCANKNAVSFIKAHLSDAQTLAADLNVPVAFILAVSEDESAFGSSNYALQANNYFGLWPGAPGNIGTYTSPKGGRVSIFSGPDGFLSSGQSFVNLVDPWENGVTNPDQFFAALHNVYKFGAGSTTNGYVSMMDNIASMTAARINCK